MRRLFFYGLLFPLVVLNGYLLSKANILGKIGLFIYRYQYLKNFTNALLTVTLVTATAIVIAELILIMVRKENIKRSTGILILASLATAATAVFVYTVIVFLKNWSYGHIGLRFQIGAALLPVLLIGIFVFALFKLPKVPAAFPLSPVTDAMNDEETSNLSE